MHIMRTMHDLFLTSIATVYVIKPLILHLQPQQQQHHNLSHPPHRHHWEKRKMKLRCIMLQAKPTMLQIATLSFSQILQRRCTFTLSIISRHDSDLPPRLTSDLREPFSFLLLHKCLRVIELPRPRPPLKPSQEKIYWTNEHAICYRILKLSVRKIHCGCSMRQTIITSNSESVEQRRYRSHVMKFVKQRLNAVCCKEKHVARI